MSIDLNNLFVPNLDFSRGDGSSGYADVFTDVPLTPIDQLNWPQFPYKPDTGVRVAHNGRSIWLHFEVVERHIACSFREVNDPVHRDSCVEFFLSFGEGIYFNFEFNCLGTPYAAFGSANLLKRKQLPKSSLRNLYRSSDLEKQGELYRWTLSVEIPISLLGEAVASAGLSGRHAKANFYKCGDDLPEPHYLSWSPIAAPSPNFHLPDFFGNLYFGE